MKNGDTWTFDVALSFAGEDRDKARALAEALHARGLTVFYDEWYTAQLWGRNLAILLREVYLEKARLCVPLISRAYVQGSYPKHELSVILERELLGAAGALLPVRLDDAEAPGLSRLIAFVPYDREGPEGIAALIAERLKTPAEVGSAREQPQPTRASTPAPARHVLSSHARVPPSKALGISDPELLDLVRQTPQNASAELQARLARELVIFLNWKCATNLGIPYGAWWDGPRLLLSTLPDFRSPQRTLEFEWRREREELSLTSEWESRDPRYDKLQYWEWQPAVKGLTADRMVPRLEREVAILILEKKGAEFGFPIIPEGRAPVKLCGWLPQNPPEDYLEWGRDPRLTPAQVGFWLTFQHRPTSVGVLVFSIMGRWSSSALLTMNEALRVLLPTRHRVKLSTEGSLRVCIFLATTGGETETEYVGLAIERSYATVARMAAADRQLPVAPPSAASALPPLSRAQASLFAEAADALGDTDYPKAVDQSEPDFGTATWIKLRHSRHNHRIGLVYDPPRFDFGDVVTPAELRAYVESKERPE
jgi:hypothetical protein